MTVYLQQFKNHFVNLSYNVASGSEIMSCNKIDKPLVVYRFLGNVLTSIITLRIYSYSYIIEFIKLVAKTD